MLSLYDIMISVYICLHVLGLEGPWSPSAGGSRHLSTMTIISVIGIPLACSSHTACLLTACINSHARARGGTGVLPSEYAQH